MGDDDFNPGKRNFEIPFKTKLDERLIFLWKCCCLSEDERINQDVHMIKTSFFVLLLYFEGMALCHAARTGNVSYMKRLQKDWGNELNINWQDGSGNTALHYTALQAQAGFQSFFYLLS